LSFSCKDLDVSIWRDNDLLCDQSLTVTSVRNLLGLCEI
jgi:hypothetical protein